MNKGELETLKAVDRRLEKAIDGLVYLLDENPPLGMRVSNMQEIVEDLTSGQQALYSLVDNAGINEELPVEEISQQMGSELRAMREALNLTLPWAARLQCLTPDFLACLESGDSANVDAMRGAKKFYEREMCRNGDVNVDTRLVRLETALENQRQVNESLINRLHGLEKREAGRQGICDQLAAHLKEVKENDFSNELEQLNKAVLGINKGVCSLGETVELNAKNAMKILERVNDQSERLGRESGRLSTVNGRVFELLGRVDKLEGKR